MDDALLDERDEAVADLPEELDGFLLGQFLFGLQVFIEVAVANLLDDVVVIIALHHVQHADHVFGLQQLQDLDLGQQGRFEVFVLVDWVRE